MKRFSNALIAILFVISFANSAYASVDPRIIAECRPLLETLHLILTNAETLISAQLSNLNGSQSSQQSNDNYTVVNAAYEGCKKLISENLSTIDHLLHDPVAFSSNAEYVAKAAKAVDRIQVLEEVVKSIKPAIARHSSRALSLDYSQLADNLRNARPLIQNQFTELKKTPVLAETLESKPSPDSNGKPSVSHNQSTYSTCSSQAPSHVEVIINPFISLLQGYSNQISSEKMLAIRRMNLMTSEIQGPNQPIDLPNPQYISGIRHFVNPNPQDKDIYVLEADLEKLPASEDRYQRTLYNTYGEPIVKTEGTLNELIKLAPMNHMLEVTYRKPVAASVQRVHEPVELKRYEYYVFGPRRN